MQDYIGRRRSVFKKWQRVFAILQLVLLIALIAPNAIAQESPLPTPSESPSPEPDATSTETPAPTPSANPAPSPSGEGSITPEPTPSSNPSPSAEPSTPVPTPSSNPLPEPSPSSTPSSEPAPAPQPATVTSDKEDYLPGELVTLTGAHWQPAEPVHVVVNDDAGQTWKYESDVTAGTAGSWTLSFNLPTYFVAYYGVAATGPISGRVTTTFTDAALPSNVKLEQWDPPSSSWVTGQAGAGYTEGNTVPIRLDVGGLATSGNPYTFSICRDFQNGSTFGYFSILPYNTSFAPPPGGTITSTSGPISGINVTITSVVEVGGQGACGAGQRETQVTFTSTNNAAQYILWGGKLAAPSDPGVGVGHAAGQYSGSSLSMQLLSPAKNLAMKPSDIIELANITVTKVVDSGTASPDQWCFTISPVPAGDTATKCPTTGGNTVTWTGINATGNFTITESSVPNYHFASGTGTNCTFSGSTATASVATGTTATNATCTFHNARDVASPTIATTVQNTNGGDPDTPVSDNATVPLGSVVYDTSVLTGFVSGGGTATVSYRMAGPFATQAAADAFTCGAGGSLIGSAVTVGASGIVPNSSNVTLSAAGIYEFWAVFSGNSLNNGTSSTCHSETVVAGKRNTSTATVLRRASNDAAIADDASLANPTTVYDTAQLTGATGDAAGTVSYFFKKVSNDPSTIPAVTATTCTAGTQIGSDVTVAAGVAPNSANQALSSAGVYEFWAVYSGDANNVGSTSPCGTETVTVAKNVTSTATQVKRTTTNANVADNGTVPNGTAVYDTATLSGATTAAGGTVSYYRRRVSTDPSTIPAVTATTCAPSDATTLISTVNVTNHLAPQSANVTLNMAGVYEFWAVYSGDANNLGSTSSCGTETVVVPLNVTGTATQVKLASNNSNVADGGQVIAGATVYDTATLSGASSNAGGTVTYYVEKGDSNCTIAGATVLGTKTVTNGVVPKSDNFSFPAGGGVYEFWAVYSGDGNNVASTSVCGTETVVAGMNLGAHTIGFWQNKNGQEIIKSYCGGTSGTTLRSFLLQYKPFQDMTATTCSAIATYVTNIIKAANSSGSSMNPMLKAQMLATALSVYFSDPSLGGNRIGAPAPIGPVVIDLTQICKMPNHTTCSGSFRDVSAAFGGATSMSVSQMLAYQNNVSNVGGTTWYGQVKTTQELAKDAFDAINNNVVFAP